MGGWTGGWSGVGWNGGRGGRGGEWVGGWMSGRVHEVVGGWVVALSSLMEGMAFLSYFVCPRGEYQQTGRNTSANTGIQAAVSTCRYIRAPTRLPGTRV